MSFFDPITVQRFERFRRNRFGWWSLLTLLALSLLALLGPGQRLQIQWSCDSDYRRELLAYHEAILRGPSPLSPGERELIAAFVSALNACTYCHGVHAATAEAFGVDASLIESMVADAETAPVSSKLKPLLLFIRKLTLTPARMIKRDADAVFSAGWDERALHDAICVAALFNFMNRYVDGHGLSLADAELTKRGEGLMRDGYASLAAWLPPSSPASTPSPRAMACGPATAPKPTPSPACSPTSCSTSPV